MGDTPSEVYAEVVAIVAIAKSDNLMQIAAHHLRAIAQRMGAERIDAIERQRGIAHPIARAKLHRGAIAASRLTLHEAPPRVAVSHQRPAAQVRRDPCHTHEAVVTVVIVVAAVVEEAVDALHGGVELLGKDGPGGGELLLKHVAVRLVKLLTDKDALVGAQIALHVGVVV